MLMDLHATAALCQEAGIVPIVEPEVLMDGDHSLERCEEVTAASLDVVFAELKAHQGRPRRDRSEAEHGDIR